jgi:predicted NAD/FAD-binding protein
MLVTGNHLERWVGAYNAYRSWESSVHLASPIVEADPVFEGASVAGRTELPATAAEGQVVFVGSFADRDGDFAELRGGRWLMNDERE